MGGRGPIGGRMIIKRKKARGLATRRKKPNVSLGVKEKREKLYGAWETMVGSDQPRATGLTISFAEDT